MKKNYAEYKVGIFSLSEKNISGSNILLWIGRPYTILRKYGVLEIKKAAARDSMNTKIAFAGRPKEGWGLK